MTDSNATLGDLLDDPDLGLKLVIGDARSSRRQVIGAHSIEVRHPVQWLEAKWIMLTTGTAWRTERAQRELIEELAAGGITALGFGVDVVFRDVPAAMRTAAERLSFPLFTIPRPTPFRDVTGAVLRNTLSSEILRFNRLGAIQRYLIDALREPDATACIVDRLAKVLGAEVAVANPDGTIAEGSCAVPPPRLAACLSSATSHATRIDEGELSGWVLPIGSGPESWLVVRMRPGRDDHPLLKPAAQAALPLFVAIGHLNDVRIAEKRAAKRAVLDVLLDSPMPQDADVAAARAAAWGVDLSDGVRVVIARPIGTADAGPEDRLGRMVTQLEAARIPAFATVFDNDVTLLLPAKVDLETLERVLLGLDPSLLLGVGRVVNSASLVSTSRTDANMALRWNRRTDSRCRSYDDLDLATTLIAEVPAERIRPKVDRWLELLSASPIAIETLKAYFEHDLDVGRTSRALHLHPNSTRYRLVRVEELLGVRLRRPDTIATLHLALLAHEYGSESAGLRQSSAPPLRGRSRQHDRVRG